MTRQKFSREFKIEAVKLVTERGVTVKFSIVTLVIFMLSLVYVLHLQRLGSLVDEVEAVLASPRLALAIGTSG